MTTSTERNRHYYAKMTPNERTRRRSAYAVKRRIDLVRVLAEPGPNGGGLCAKCKTEHAHSELEIDHVDKITWVHRDVASWVRAARYWKEHKAGIELRAVCRGCNAEDGARRQWKRRF